MAVSGELTRPASGRLRNNHTVLRCALPAFGARVLSRPNYGDAGRSDWIFPFEINGATGCDTEIGRTTCRFQFSERI